MNLYKIVIRPLASFCSPLQSDTFFGAFCWSYLYRYGETALQGLLLHMKNGMPDIIFSNAFPSGRLPMPVGIRKPGGYNDSLTKQERYHNYMIAKRQERIATISLDDFNRFANGNMELIPDDLHAEAKVMSWRNMVSRETDTVEGIDGEGHLFEVDEIYSEGTYDVYIYSALEETVLENTLKEMFRLGIGAQRSVGKGAFSMEGKPEMFDGFEEPENPNAFVALSNFIPQNNDPTDGYYKTFVKYPKVSHVSSEEDSPFKKPLIFLEAGSVFFDEPVKAFYGTCMKRIAVKAGVVSDDIVIGAYTIAVPCRLSH